MFNREYQIRATRQAILAEIHKGFYRPASRPEPVPAKKKKKNVSRDQLCFDFEAKHCPLGDLFPDAYE
jgi:hypothetical protein